MRTTSAPADSGTERHVTIGLEGNVDEEYSGDYDPEAIADFSGSIGDYSGDNGPEGIWDFSGSIGDYPGDNGPEGIWDFSGSLGDYSGDYAPENTGEDYSGSGDYGPEGIADSCEDYGTGRYAEYCGLYGPENVGPGSTHTPTPQWGSPTFLTPVVFLILAVQLSVVVFLVVRGRKEKTFRQGFYLFFVAVTLVESLIVLMVSRPTNTALGGLVVNASIFHGKLSEIVSLLILPSENRCAAIAAKCDIACRVRYKP